MKKLLMLLLIGLLIILSIFIVINGFEVGNIEVLSYQGIQLRDKEVDEKIQEASKLATKDFTQSITTIEENTKKLEQTKKEYEDMVAITSEGDLQSATQIQKYEVETLWVKLGNYATTEGAVIRIDVVKEAGNTEDNYNLRFTVNGSYISITDFISDIENDTTLGFKIEEFQLLPTANTAELQATFVCKDISIVDVSQTSNTNIGRIENTTTTNTTTSTDSRNTPGTSNVAP